MYGCHFTLNTLYAPFIWVHVLHWNETIVYILVVIVKCGTSKLKIVYWCWSVAHKADIAVKRIRVTNQCWYYKLCWHFNWISNLQTSWQLCSILRIIRATIIQQGNELIWYELIRHKVVFKKPMVLKLVYEFSNMFKVNLVFIKDLTVNEGFYSIS